MKTDAPIRISAQVLAAKIQATSHLFTGNEEKGRQL